MVPISKPQRSRGDEAIAELLLVLVAVLPAFCLLYILFAHPSPEMTQ
jgi:uncharacterized paraquat-inducible protein A